MSGLETPTAVMTPALMPRNADGLTNLRDGTDRCPYCMRPMHRRQRLDLDDFPARILAIRAGITPVKRLSHRSCNRRARGRLRNALRKH